MLLIHVDKSEVHHIAHDEPIPRQYTKCMYPYRYGPCGYYENEYGGHPEWARDHEFVYNPHIRNSRCHLVKEPATFSIEGIVALGTRTCKQCLRAMGAEFHRKWGIVVA